MIHTPSALLRLCRVRLRLLGMAEPKTALELGESVVEDARANLQRGMETVGGRLS